MPDENWNEYLPDPDEHAREVWEWFSDMMESLDRNREQSNPIGSTDSP